MPRQQHENAVRLTCIACGKVNVYYPIALDMEQLSNRITKSGKDRNTFEKEYKCRKCERKEKEISHV